MAVRIGELDERIELQQEQHSSDGQGGTTTAWQTVATVWAQVRPKGGSESLHSDAVQAEKPYRVVIRNQVAVKANWRIVWRGVTMNIRSPGYSGPRDLYRVMEADAGVPS